MSLLSIILLPLVGLILPILAARRSRTAASVAAFVPPAAALGLLASFAPRVFRGETIVHSWPWMPEFGLDLALRLDGLGWFFALLILAIGLLVVTYAHWYLHDDDPPGRFYGSLLLFMGAMLGVVLSENLLLLVVFWELTSISSFLLIGYWHHRPVAREGARMALAITGSGGLALIGGVLLLGEITGSYQLTQVLASGETIRSSSLYVPALVLVLLGAFTKSAQFPFHSWLPNAMTAPTPVSAYLHSATMVKAGIFLMARLHPALAGTQTWTLVVGGTGLFTMLFAAYVALRKHDLKGLLAYSTISHLGLITALLGFGFKAAVFAAIFHIFNHAAFKASLFMTAGIVDHEAGSRDMRELGGLRHSMPLMFGLGTLGAAAMAGVPFFNGFLSKEMFFKDALKVAEKAHLAGTAVEWIAPVVATLGGIFSVAYSIRFVSDTFLGEEREEYPGHPHDPPFGFWMPVGVLVAISVAVGLVPNAIAQHLVEYASSAAYWGEVGGEHSVHRHIAIWHGFNTPLLMSAIAFAVGFVFFALRWQLIGLHESFPDVTGKKVFEGLVDTYVSVGRFVTDHLENGSLQRYAAFVMTTAVVAGALPFAFHEFAFGSKEMLPVNTVAVTGWVLLVAAAVTAAAVHRHRMQSLISVGLVGLMIALAFVHLSGPDLAMTQLSVEVVNVLLLLLALFALPETSPNETGTVRTVRDLGVAVLLGAGAAFLSFSIMTRGQGDTIAQYFLAKSYTGGHGTNVVNVILVDFRAFDTMGEISVLVIAALGITSMLTGERPSIPQPRPAARERFPMILSHVARPLMALVLAAAVYIFLRGHNQPGGGFIAGLVATVALVIQYVAHGSRWSNIRMQTNFRATALFGVVLAILSGIAAWAFSTPLLSQGKIYLHIPFVGKEKFVSTLAFDLGVFFAVVGSVMTMLLRLGEFNREDSPEPIDPLTKDEEEHDPWRP